MKQKPKSGGAVRAATTQDNDALIAYAKTVLTVLALDEEWNSDTTQAICNGAIRMGLASILHTGQFIPSQRSGVNLDYEILEELEPEFQVRIEYKAKEGGGA